MFNSAQSAQPQNIAHFIIAIDAKQLSVDGADRTGEFAQAVASAGGRLPGANRANPEALNPDDEITITDAVAEQVGLK